MTTWTNGTKPNVRPTIWTLTTQIWNNGIESEYLEFPWQEAANNIWTNASKPS